MKVPDFLFKSIDHPLNCSWIIDTLHLHDFFQKLYRFKLTTDINWVNSGPNRRLNIDNGKKRLQKLRVKLSLKSSILEDEQVKEEVQETIEKLLALNCICDFKILI